MKIKSARRITPEPARCIEVDSPDRLFAAGGSRGQSFLSHNSVAQRNIVFGCILRPESWRFLGIDLKRVELSVYRAYSNVVLGIATTLEDALTVLRFAQQTMMKRYGELETLGLNNFLDLPNKGQALMVMVDEAGELLGSSGVKALAADTYIPNLNGRRNISEIKIGDTVFNSDGQFTKVLDKYIPEHQEQFDLVIKNSQSVSSGKLTKETIRTGADHYWVVMCPNEDHQEEHTLTTRQLFEELSLTTPGSHWKIKRVSGGIQSREQEFFVEPHVLGQQLAGKELLSPETKAALELENGLPDRYLYSSEAQRYELLTGIFGMDAKPLVTDDLYLIQDVQRVISSLGLKPILREVPEGIEIYYEESDEQWFEIESLTSIEDESDLQELYCLRVASDDSQFLCSENFIPTHNTDEGKEQDQLKGEASMIIGSIARLGRAAGVHLIIATQRPDATLIAGETKANLGVRINCGRTNSTASSMILESGEGSRVKANPRGRLYLQIYGRGDHGQGFFADQSWIDNYLASQGLNPDGSPLNQKQSRLAKLTDFGSEFGEGADLDGKAGIDNSEVIEKIRQEEASRGGAPASDDFDDEDDWGFDESDETAAGDDEDDAPKKDDGWGGLELGKGEKKGGRPEDDWDDDLDSLIDDNFNEGN